MPTQYVAKITDKGQITLPKQLREEFSLDVGDYLILMPQGQGVRLEKAAISPISRFQAMAEETEQRFQSEGVRQEDVEEAIRWSRERA